MSGRAWAPALAAAAAALVAALALVPAPALAQDAPAPRGHVGLAGFCNHTSNCSASNAVCIGNQCSCATGYEANGTACAIRLNSTCNSTHPCNRTGAQCTNGVCLCRSDFVLSTDYQNCVSVATGVNQPCEVVAQCREILNSSCIAGMCRCNPGHHYDANRRGCARNTIISDIVPQTTTSFKPQQNPEPNTNGMVSTGVAETHPPPEIRNPTNGVRNKVDLGGKCNTSLNCSTPFSQCITNSCQCMNNYERNGSICISKVNTTCTSSTSCNRNGTECDRYTNTCICNSAHVYSKNGRDCLKRASRVYDRCLENGQCRGVPNTECMLGACQCKDHYFPNAGGTSCELRRCDGQSCPALGYAVCVGNNCQCRSDAVQLDRCYKPIRKVGEKCDTSQADLCYLDNTGRERVQCEKGKCTCKKGFKANKSKTSCNSGAYAAVASSLVVMVSAAMSLRV